ncbi:hypothetical protein FIV06_15645 [Labrenzia sp. THAF191b]|uniref:hypothetical protein n=1 Tax=unclassified Labrenzia TaxID=2648686 RepID=UPI001268498F|nr:MULTISPECIES: hypothetical protein [unclassified Labrenzia]QFS98861.1 hypothetical protein FIV06_15645 [Labrenzia sp. THAF191b]QFT05175.1 hypothetical protein FIV05_15640 [Labrenzia sp. THAF191a]QFT16719.1 hypothetical protein FIV03_15655 [Labrenzia sp. THAF187b]
MTDNYGIFSPLEIHTLLFGYALARPRIQLGEHLTASVAREAALKHLEKEGLIDENWRTTERGDKLVHMLCTTPAPVAIWSDPRSMESRTGIAPTPIQIVTLQEGQANEA